MEKKKPKYLLLSYVYTSLENITINQQYIYTFDKYVLMRGHVPSTKHTRRTSAVVGSQMTQNYTLYLGFPQPFLNPLPLSSVLECLKCLGYPYTKQ